MLQLLTGLICKWNSGTWHEHNVLAEDTETQLICLISHFMSLSPFLRGTAVAGRYVVSTAMLPLQSLTRSPPPPCKLTTIFSVRSEITQTKACLENILSAAFIRKHWHVNAQEKKNYLRSCRSSSPLLPTKTHYENISSNGTGLTPLV